MERKQPNTKNRKEVEKDREYWTVKIKRKGEEGFKGDDYW